MDSPANLRLGLPLAPWAMPLAQGLGELPGVSLEWGAPEDLLAGIRAGAYEAALLPPLLAVQVARGKVVPGVGAYAAGPGLAGAFHYPMPYESGGAVAVARICAAEFETARVVLHAAFGPLGEAIPWDTAQALPIGARAAFAPDWLTHELGGRFAAHVETAAHWTARTGAPLVLGLWVGRLGANLPALRKATALAQRNGRGDLDRIAEREAPRFDMAPATLRAYYASALRFAPACEEFAAARLLIAEAVALGYLESNAELVLC